MNDRIKELMNEAVRFHWDHDGQAYEAQVHPEDLEYFAELIVGECVKLCEHESNDDEYDQYDMGMSVKAEDIKASIMKTFGVK